MGAEAVQQFIDKVNTEYAALHKAFEDNFWATKMFLKGNSTEELTRTKNVYEAYLRDPKHIEAIKAHLPDATPEQAEQLRFMEKVFGCYTTQSAEGAALKEKTVALEGELEERRAAMKLGYTDPATGEFKPGTAGSMRTLMRTADDEALRKAAYEGMRTIGPFVAKDFCEIVKLRNKFSRAMGYADYYEYKLQTTEWMDKKRLFEILGDLEEQTRPLLERARAKLAETKGASALEPWNMGYMMAGDVTKAMDPYFPFEEAVPAWGRSFAALGIDYQGSTMSLDLCARDKKYDNGFCHWPQCPYVKSDGTFVPCVTNFTSLAIPSQVGSGHTALNTLMHEGGHAAHMANIRQKSPLYALERAPMSVAYAENQSMFLDSLVGDAAWLGRYAKSRDGKVLPWELIEKKIRQTHDYQVFAVRSMLIVPFFEKELYELPEDQVTAENVIALADKIDLQLFGGHCARPCLSVPHILSDESSCYYQGYILAEMSVYQTRSHFLKKYGVIVDNEQVGKDLTEAYWRCGSSRLFLDVVKDLTGRPLTADDLVNDYKEDVEERLAKEKKDYEEAVAKGPKFSEKDDVMSVLNMHMKLVHGDELISDSKEDGGFTGATNKFKEWIAKTFPREN